MPVGNPNVGLFPQIRAPLGVILEQLTAELPQNGAVEGVDIVRGRVEAHLSVGEMEDDVLALVANVVVLEAKEQGEPVEEVHVGLPLGVWGTPEVSDGA